MDFFNYDSNIKVKKGSVLISEPFLADSNFERTVILLCEHDENGSFGFVLNKPTELIVRDLLEENINIDKRVFIGGPVQQNSFNFIHCDASVEGSQKITNSLFWGGNFEQLKVRAETNQLNIEFFKFFIGYSGWSQGQLDQELEAKSWIVAENIDNRLLLSEGKEETWKKILDGLGGRFSLYSKYPIDPRLN